MKNSAMLGLCTDLKKHMRDERKKLPNSGTAYAIKRHHIHSTRSSSGSTAVNCLTPPEIISEIYIKHSYRP